MIKNIKSTNMEMTSAISQYIEKKIGSLDKLLCDGDQDAVIMSIEVGKNTNHHKSGNVFFAEMNLMNCGKDFRAKHEADDLYAAIDKMKDLMTELLRTAKGKKQAKIKGKEKMK